MTISSMYVRVKRENITYFIQADPSDTILELKEQLQELIDQVGETTNARGRPCSPFAR